MTAWGKISQRAAEEIRSHVGHLVETKLSGGAMEDETARWLGKLGQTLLDKLAAVNLIAARETATLGAFLDDYVAGRADVKASTAIVYRHTRRCLVEYLGAGKPLSAITRGDADAWRIWLGTDQKRGDIVVRRKLGDNTVRRRCGIARQFFRNAVRRKLIPENPFGDLRDVGVKGDRSREFFITPEMAARVLEACPDAEWRLLFALSRYGGLRRPSGALGPTVGATSTGNAPECV